MPCGCEDIPTVRSKGPSGPCCRPCGRRSRVAMLPTMRSKGPSGLSPVSVVCEARGVSTLSWQLSLTSEPRFLCDSESLCLVVRLLGPLSEVSTCGTLSECQGSERRTCLFDRLLQLVRFFSRGVRTRFSIEVSVWHVPAPYSAGGAVAVFRFSLVPGTTAS